MPVNLVGLGLLVAGVIFIVMAGFGFFAQRGVVRGRPAGFDAVGPDRERVVVPGAASLQLALLDECGRHGELLPFGRLDYAPFDAGDTSRITTYSPKRSRASPVRRAPCRQYDP